MTQKALFDYKKTLVDPRSNMTLEERLKRPEMEDETRSIRSEFDYTTKKKFVEMISKEKKQSKLSNIPENALSPNRDGDKMSTISKRSGLSVRSNRGGLNAKNLEGVPTKGTVDTILEHPNETTEEPNQNGDRLTN